MNNQDTEKTLARLHQIGAEEAGQRIDNFLLRVFKNIPKSHVYKMLRGGQVRVNKGRIRATYRLNEGDLVRIPPVVQGLESEIVSRPIKFDTEAIVLHEDASLLVLNKPAGLAVHGGSGLSFGLIEALRANRPDAPFLELVHRLDRDTSGCLMIAKKRSVLKDLHDQLRNNLIDKHYLVLARGKWRGGSRTVDLALRKNNLSSGERVVRPDASGKAASTHFVPIRLFQQASLLRAELETGRTHQIRVHLQSLGKPIAGDEKYGDESFNKDMKSIGLKRLFLHAAELDFMHPVKGERIRVEAVLPNDLQNVLLTLESLQT